MSTWYPIALAGGLEPGVSTGTRVHGQEFVVWRDQTGASHVWEDRCPHRGMRFSFGFVRGDHLACLYHGWQFDAAGQCRLIPAHPDIVVPKTIRATRYSSVERLGMIWLQLAGDGEDEPPIDAGPVTPVRTLTIEAPSARVSSVPLARLEVDDLTVIMALQPLSDTETALHLAIEGVFGATEQKRVAHWGAALRARLEAP